MVDLGAYRDKFGDSGQRVLENALGGGVTRSLAIDPHGKSLSALMLTIELPGHNEPAPNG